VKRRRIVVIGAGAAGTMAAIFSASTDAETLLLERTPDGGRKILISGGGRCNVLPVREATRRFVTASSARTLARMLRSWPLRDQIRFFEEDLGIVLTEEPETGKLFPSSNRARDVRDGLLHLARRRGVSFLPGTLVTGLESSGGRWRVLRQGASPLEADAVVVAAGGLSVPKSGSDGALLPALRSLGHTIRPTYPALTPLVAPPASPYAGLAGVSLRVALTARGDDRRWSASGGFLFTHRGYSGPAVLDVSHVAVRAIEAGGTPALAVRWTEEDEAGWTQALRPEGSRTVAGALRGRLPERLAAAVCGAAAVDPARRLAQLKREERRRLIEALVRGDLPCEGHEGYAKAEVTGGGVSLDDVDPATMESRRTPGLFLCGEILDAFGPIVGYNFQWAWATGRAAGIAAATTPLSSPPPFATR
jgi:predicted Rossmann fold flavoprotein